MSQADRKTRVRALALMLAVPLLLARADGAAAQRAEPGSPDFTAAGAIAAHGFPADQVGYVLFELAGGRVIASHNADRPFIPASVAKVPTTVAALSVLGADYRFETSLWATGPVNAGRLDGDLVLRGGGDPVLTTDDMAGLVEALEAHGIAEISGRFGYDETWLASAGAIDPTQPESASYNPGVGALSLNFNIVHVTWERRGDRFVRAAATSNTDTLRLPARSITFGPGGSDAEAWYDHSFGEDGEHWALSPALPAEGADWLPVRAPGLNAAGIFQALAAEHGIGLRDPEPSARAAGAWQVGAARSRPLAEIVRGVLRYSNNLSAELIGLAASRTLAGEPLTMADSSEVLARRLAELLPDADWRGFELVNHSGLSSASRAAPMHIAGVLRLAALQPPGGAEYFDLLRRVSWEGHLNESRPDGAAPIRVRAKSGTMNYARGLAGYIDPGDGPRLGFVVFVTDYEARAILDADDDPRAREATARSRRWLGRARELERALITHWALAAAD
jgi:D-alanyl-D-alanine carboxypeptidase/D-alanyl-D-alanine-endopeptidase (penicillin-binding protein 4)